MRSPKLATDAPLDPAILEALKKFDSPTLSNAIETFEVRPRDEGYMSMDIRCLFPELGPMVGYAATGTIRAKHRVSGDQTALYQHVRDVPGPRVVVVRDLDDPPGHGSLWGEVNATIFGALGCAGCVTDGCVRDLKEARAIGFHFFARGPGVSHAYVRVESAGHPVMVGGLHVSPGDLLHADQHGVLLIPRQIAGELPAAAARVVAAEQSLLNWVRSSDFDVDELIERRRVKH
ncbi:MAG TPA: RraA family protein [Candidatus Dormibacteraeota bacterium]|nr:RraA family protein [Candidatus Dormibacteraeota bacterium]